MGLVNSILGISFQIPATVTPRCIHTNLLTWMEPGPANESMNSTSLPSQQTSIWNRCFHPSGSFIEFKREAIEQSIPDRFEEQVRKYPERLAVKSKTQELSYEELNQAANRVARAVLAHQGDGAEPVALLSP